VDRGEDSHQPEAGDPDDDADRTRRESLGAVDEFGEWLHLGDVLIDLDPLARRFAV
jgi:hypothetical protein